MSDADEFGLLAEWYEGLLVLEPDHARGLEARYTDANKFVEEDAVVRIASAFRHELKAAPRAFCGQGGRIADVRPSDRMSRVDVNRPLEIAART